jgi:hypothetical protein
MIERRGLTQAAADGLEQEYCSTEIRSGKRTDRHGGRSGASEAGHASYTC